MVERLDENDHEAWLDSAYVGEDLEKEVRETNPDIILRINEKGKKNKPLTEAQKAANREKSKTRARIARVNGQMTVCGECLGNTRKYAQANPHGQTQTRT